MWLKDLNHIGNVIPNINISNADLYSLGNATDHNPNCHRVELQFDLDLPSNSYELVRKFLGE